MFFLVLTALLRASTSEVPPDRWICSNEVEVWCSSGGCAARDPGETTPMSIATSRDGAFSVCAYTGCWEGRATVTSAAGRLLWTAEGVPFSTRPEGMAADVTLLIVEAENVGFVRVGAIASPLMCARAPLIEAEAP